MRAHNKKRLVAALSSAVCLSLTNFSHGEVVFDGSLGPTGTMTGNMVIGDSFGQQLGANLFHSFQIFNINLGETALFTSTSVTPIDNVIARVTGGALSSINGELGSDIPGASVWLINPSGIFFGESATLNVSGSFHATTADYVTLDDGGQFGADLSIAANTTLTIADPAAFGFLDLTVAPISIQDSVLVVNNGESLSFVGGDIQISGGPLGFLFAPGGDINIASVASAGEATIGAAGIDISTFPEHGDITITDGGFLSVSESAGFNGAGSVYIRGGNLFIDNSFIFSTTFSGDSGVIDIAVSGDALISGSVIASNSLAVGQPSDIRLTAGGDLVVALGSQIRSSTDFIADAGDIILNAANILVAEQSRVSSVTFGSGGAGDVFVTAADTIAIVNSAGTLDFSTGIASESFSAFDFGNAGDVFLSADLLFMDAGLVSSESGSPFSFGAAGDITINVDQIDMTNEALITSSTRGFGAGGSISVNASSDISLSGLFTAIQSTSNGIGNSGPINITTPELTLSAGALIQTAPFSSGAGGDISVVVERLILSNGQISSGPIFTAAAPSSGQAGAISIVASDFVLLENPLDDPIFKPRITSTTFGTGDAGAISIVTPSLTVNNGGIDTNSLVSPFGPIIGTGDAGVINIDVSNLMVVNGGSISSDTDTDGAGGQIVINATDTILVAGQAAGLNNPVFSSITTSTLGPGNAGSIDISADSLVVEDEGAIIAFTALDVGQGGSIDIDARDIRLENNGSILTASVDSTGNAGSIAITTNNLSLFAASDIITSSTQSAGGNIDIQVTNLVHIVDSRITSDANGVTPTDSGGNIQISQPEFFVLNNGEINASANAANGGNITIVTGAFVSSSDSIVTAKSEQAVDGIITIESPNNVTGTVVELTAEIFSVDELLTDQCSPRAIRERSTFTLEGGGAPARPDGYLSAGTSLAAPTAAQTTDYAEARLANLYVTARPGECGS